MTDAQLAMLGYSKYHNQFPMPSCGIAGWRKAMSRTQMELNALDECDDQPKWKDKRRRPAKRGKLCPDCRKAWCCNAAARCKKCEYRRRINLGWTNGGYNKFNPKKARKIDSTNALDLQPNLS